MSAYRDVSEFQCSEGQYFARKMLEPPQVKEEDQGISINASRAHELTNHELKKTTMVTMDQPWIPKPWSNNAESEQEFGQTLYSLSAPGPEGSEYNSVVPRF